jgi:poly(3-hydroxybutyrate) depolymerase
LLSGRPQHTCAARAEEEGEMTRCLAVAAAASTLLIACGTPARGAGQLEALAIEPGSVTVSGISSGASMATQFHVAYSSLVNGAALIAGAPYYCAANSVINALGRCMKGDEDIPVGEFVALTNQWSVDGSIDPVAGLVQDRVWIFHGAKDPYVRKPVADAVESYYQALVKPDNIARVEYASAGHTFPTARTDARDCESSEPPFLGNCGLDGAAALLGYLYGTLQDGRAPRPGELSEFDQTPYAQATGSSSLADRGWIFVPESCSGGGQPPCRLHVVFHGCKQGATPIGKEFITGSGYLEAAAANSIVLLFPQVKASDKPLNPLGCWDWWGYEGASYAVKAGPQMAAVRLMIGDLLGEPRGRDDPLDDIK